MKWLCILSVVAVAIATPVREESMVSSLRDCLDGNLYLCLKEKALGYTNRIVDTPELSLIDGITLKNSGFPRSSRSFEPLAEDPKVRESQVEERIGENVSSFLDGLVVQLRLPKSLFSDDSAVEEEGRGKKGKKKLKKLLPLLAILKLKVAALVPIFLGVIAFVVVKALLLAKIVFAVSAITLLKKLLDSKKQSSWPEAPAVEHGGWESGGGGGGWGRSSLDAHDLAYSGQVKQSS